MEHLLYEYGLWAVFFLSMVDYDVVFIMAGVMSRMGYFHLDEALFVGFVGLMATDLVWYGVGRVRSNWIHSTAIYRKAAPTVEKLVGQLGAWELLAARVVYGTRIVSMLYWGSNKLHVGRFVAIDALGGIVWTLFLVNVGYWMSDEAILILGKIKHVELWLLGFLIIALLVYLGLDRWARREMKITVKK